MKIKKSISILLLFTFGLIQSQGFSQSKKNDWENPELVSQNTVAPHAWFVTKENEQSAINDTPSPFVKSLNGQWKFKLAENPAQRPATFFKDDYNTDNWDNIKVPANWQVEGFDKFIFTDVEYPIKPNPPFVPEDYNPVGSYKRSFNVPANWNGKDIFIRLGAVNSFFYLWINGHYVGLSKDSKTPAEFNITQYLRKGENTVSVQVFRFSDGTYLEGQDMWKLSGIERNVELIARPKLSIFDFFVQADLNSDYLQGVFKLSVNLNRQPLQSENGEFIEVKLLDDANGMKPIYAASKKTNSKDFLFESILPNVRKWNAETPNLYTLIINHKGKSGKIIESIAHRIGFRKVEIKHGLFLVNGVAIKIKGTNRHEHDMITGKVITVESMINDIKVLKQFNINAVRNSHYPNREEWYELCDKYGIYLIDEANVECDGMDFHPLKTLSDKPEWKAAYLDRTKRMVERDKNFCSIITWSLGNESRFGDNFIATYNWTKQRDKTRPVQYEEARELPYSDIFCPMYKSLHIMQEYVRDIRTRPLIQCEYAHMMGNSGGNLKDDWDLIYMYRQLQGGFIWDFSDQTFKRKDENGRDIWAFGSDLGTVGVTSDTSFCADGMFAADRTPHPQAYEVKKVYQNIHFESVDFAANQISITNRFDFTNLKEYDLKWKIKADGKVIGQGTLPVIDLEPHQDTVITVDLPKITPTPGTEYFLWMEAFPKHENVFFSKDHVIAWEQFKLPVIKEKEKINPATSTPLLLNENASSIAISNNDLSLVFNKTTGNLSDFKFKGVSLLKEDIQLNFWRAVTDNDIGNSLQVRCAVWKNAGSNAKLSGIAAKQLTKRLIQVDAVYDLADVASQSKISYLINSNGDVTVKASFIAGERTFPELPRFGLRLILNKEFETVKWLGRGPFDNYNDRNYAAAIDIYEMSASKLFHPYPRAQESGNRTDVRWMALSNSSGQGIMAIGSSVINTGVLHFDMQKMDFDHSKRKNVHGGSMEDEDLIWWNIDYMQMGVGGDNSWGAKTHAAYTLPFQNYSFEFTLRPFDHTKNSVELAKETYHSNSN
ncbi:Beta-galactosidase [compost metagenome]